MWKCHSTCNYWNGSAGDNDHNEAAHHNHRYQPTNKLYKNLADANIARVGVYATSYQCAKQILSCTVSKTQWTDGDVIVTNLLGVNSANTIVNHADAKQSFGYISFTKYMGTALACSTWWAPITAAFSPKKFTQNGHNAVQIDGPVESPYGLPIRLYDVRSCTVYIHDIVGC